MLKFVGGVYYIMLLYVLECVFSKKNRLACLLFLWSLSLKKGREHVGMMANVRGILPDFV